MGDTRGFHTWKRARGQGRPAVPPVRRDGGRYLA